MRYTARVRGMRLGGLVLTALCLCGAPALANGRYPNADQLLVDPGDPSHLVLRATFGTLDSRDGGSHWSWICEEAIGYVGDPALTVLRGGSVLSAYLGGVAFSTEGGCSWSQVPLDAVRRYAVDVTLDPSDPGRAWVLASSLDVRRHVSLLDLDVTGANTVPVVDDFTPSTLEVAASRPQRIYVAGFDGALMASLLMSDDRGSSWELRYVHPYEALAMYVSAVDPIDPDTLYLRVDDRTSDHLLVSRDAGQTWADVFTLEGEMLGFALAPDGKHVALGGPSGGVHVAATSDFAFQPAGAPVQSLRCLTWTARGLFACAQESLDGWTLALSTDAGQSFTPLWHVQDLVPLACEASSTTGATCPRAWLDVASRIGADLEPGAPTEVPPVPKAEGSSCELVRRVRPGAPRATLLGLLLAGAVWRLRARRS